MSNVEGSIKVFCVSARAARSRRRTRWSLPPARRAAPRGGNSQRSGDLAATASGSTSAAIFPTDCWSSMPPPAKTLRTFRRRRCALRRRARRRQSVRQQLGRPPARRRRCDRPGRSRHRGSRRSGAAHRQRRLGQRRRSGNRQDDGRDCSPACTPAGWPFRPMAATSFAQRRQRPPERHRHAKRCGRRDDLGQAEAVGSVGRLAECGRVFARRASGSTWPTARKTRSPCSTSTPTSRRESKLRGLDPRRLVSGRAGRSTHARNTIVAANIKGLPKQPTGLEDAARRRRLQFASVLRFAVDRADAVGRRAAAALGKRRRNLRQPRIAEALLPPRDRSAAAADSRAHRRAEPDSSTSSTSSRRTAPTIRCSATSDGGNGDPSLCIFGETITPNQHKIAEAVRAPRQHLLLRHPQRRRPSVEHDRLQHRLHGEELRRLSAQLSRTAWARTRTTPWPIRPPGSSGTTR